MKNEFVFLDWVKLLTWKQQSALCSSFRGPDSTNLKNIKKISKWIRATSQKNADLSSDYMKDNSLPGLKELKSELEFCTLHYCNHLLQGLEIIGYEHPDEKICKIALKYYESISKNILHLNPESKSQLEERLK